MADRPASLKTRLSAGGVVHRALSGGPREIALIKPRGGDIWTLPKGLLEGRETAEQAALREITEELGVVARIEADLGTRTYWYSSKGENVKYRKTVHYFLMAYLSEASVKQDEEVEAMGWYPIEEALFRTTYRSDREIIAEARVRLAEAGK